MNICIIAAQSNLKVSPDMHISDKQACFDKTYVLKVCFVMICEMHVYAFAKAIWQEVLVIF